MTFNFRQNIFALLYNSIATFYNFIIVEYLVYNL